ncbi:hypothetical protein FZB88_09155, partial [Enterococcus faecium]|nr:hypothetical protein [Enterococcus faecium]MCZ1212345.1 hypothetical protein [Enterococcus faecium]MCZ1222458.1 hypothetical protein [Enterococcus faecium]MCZ1230256.1 hypothetical protein [Enterococcus faecium]MCZ1237737.1 hypothetical protein [Enterococcus faecium]
NLSQNVVHSDSDLILHNSSVLIDKEPEKLRQKQLLSSQSQIQNQLFFRIIGCFFFYFFFQRIT